NGEKMFAMALVACVMLFAGIVCPKLPYNRHIGLRLPWTVQDEETWNVAHRGRTPEGKALRFCGLRIKNAAHHGKVFFS
ncbi:MAG TPA: SdpI family protein, partial [Candidatus Evtepia faecigallinarum]|nr:SdpI family protein [Candidatus Evtepia faecigallinarum]